MENSIYDTVLCRYSEIALKGNNRWQFENLIIRRIRNILYSESDFEIIKTRKRILISKKDRNKFSNQDIEDINFSLKKVFGIDSFSFCIRSNSDLQNIKDTVNDVFYSIYESEKSYKNKKNLKFRVRGRRACKDLPYTSKELEIGIADSVLNNYSDLIVNLDKADLNIYCEVHRKIAFIYFYREEGLGGLPTGSNPPALSLISGGFDSPIASYLIMKRGVPVDFLTFHSYPMTPVRTVEKIKKLVKQLNIYQKPRRLFSCNLLEVQKIISTEVFETFKTIFYRRIMIRLAEKIAIKNGNKALVTGESVGQVASQTLINLANIDDATNMLVLRPLIGMDKIDIMKIANKINTFEISKEQVPDSCTVFSPSRPSTGAPKKLILNNEKKLDVEELLQLAFKNTVLIDLENDKETPIKDIFEYK